MQCARFYGKKGKERKKGKPKSSVCSKMQDSNLYTKIELSCHVLFMALLLSYRIWRQLWILKHLMHKEYIVKQISFRWEEIEKYKPYSLDAFCCSGYLDKAFCSLYRKNDGLNFEVLLERTLECLLYMKPQKLHQNITQTIVVGGNYHGSI